MRLSRAVLGLVLGRRLPRLDGFVRVVGTSDEVVIRRDRWGVPHVGAQSEADAWFGLGFCVGQDRAFQVESLVRVIRGTLAELVGSSGLVVDRLSRRIGFRRTALRHFAALEPDVQANMESYSAGINEGMITGLGRRPHELVLLRGQTTRWDAADVLGMARLMAFLQVSNWDSELARLMVVQLDGPAALRALDPVYAEWLPVTTPPGMAAGPAVDRLAGDLDRFVAATNLGGGSNAWVLAASRSATGRPILANDPHLEPAAPPQFYLADLRCPAWHAAGASLVGLPGIFCGHNDTAAWGLTTGLVDNTDLCVEEVGADQRSVRRGDGFVACEVVEETIGVKGRAPVVERVLITPQGPVIGPALDGKVGAISLRATWLEPRQVRGLLELVRCATAADFHTRLAYNPPSSFNVVFATTDGHIGYQFAGEPPLRRTGRGVFPVSGHDAQAGWDDLVPFADLPRDLDPGCGWIATANNKPTTDENGPFLSGDFLDGYRAARIGEVLASRDDWDLGATARLQLDVFCIPWREMKDIVLAAPADSSGAGTVTRLLAGWDGQLAADSAAATVFELLTAELASRVAHAKAPHSTEWALGRGFTPLVPHTMFTVRQSTLVRLLREQPDGWFDQPWPQVIADALEAGQRQLTARYGPSPTRWAWGQVRPLRFLHPAGQRRPLGRVFNHGPLPGAGDSNTIAQAYVYPGDPTGDAVFTPCLRMVIDVGNWQNSRWALPGGQSGNPASPHYADQLQRFGESEGIPIPWTSHEVDISTQHTLHLRTNPATDTPSRREVPVSFRRLSKLPLPARRAFVKARRWSHRSSRPHPHIDLDVVDGVAVITFDDGKVNAISDRMNHMFSEAIEHVAASDQIRAVVVSGRPGQFSAGFDLDILMVGGKPRDQLLRNSWNLLGRLFTLPLPVVVACTGNAVAAGAALLLTGDLRLGAEGDFKIGFNEAAIGIPIPGVLLMLAQARLRKEFFDEAIYGARLYRPQQALAAGFLDRVVAPPDLLDTAITEARALGAQPTETSRREKETRVGPLAERMRRQLEDDMTLIERIGS